MASQPWYSDLVKAGKQSATSLKTGVQTAAQKAVSSTAQAAQKSVTGAIQKGTQKVTTKIGPAPAKPAPAKPAPAPVRAAPVAIARPVAPAAPAQARREEPQVKKAGVPMIALLAVAGGALWYFFLRKK
jgi:hypothetical protein